jgi:cold shock CspA family protein
MDGSFDGGDGRGFHEMTGTVAEWDGTSGHIIASSGERIAIYRFLLKLLGVEQPLKVGDCVRFRARVRISHELREITAIVPQEPDFVALRRLRDLNRALEKRNGDDELDIPVEELAGVVHSFDPEKGYGFIQCEEAGLILLHVTCLRASGYRSAHPGSAVRFEAIKRRKGWMAFRILSLDQPPASFQ